MSHFLIFLETYANLPTIYTVNLRRIGVHQLPWFSDFQKHGNQEKLVEWKPRKGPGRGVV